jgi:hypothetical protein
MLGRLRAEWRVAGQIGGKNKIADRPPDGGELRCVGETKFELPTERFEIHTLTDAAIAACLRYALLIRNYGVRCSSQSPEVAKRLALPAHVGQGQIDLETVQPEFLTGCIERVRLAPASLFCSHAGAER